MIFRTEREIAEHKAAITRASNKRPSRQTEQSRPGPCTVLKGDNLFTINFTKAGKPTADAQRLLTAMCAVP